MKMVRQAKTNQPMTMIMLEKEKFTNQHREKLLKGQENYVENSGSQMDSDSM